MLDERAKPCARWRKRWAKGPARAGGSDRAKGRSASKRISIGRSCFLSLHDDSSGKPSRSAACPGGSCARPGAGSSVFGKREATSPRDFVSFPCRYQRRRRSISLPPIFASISFSFQKIGNRADFVLRGQDYVYFTDRRRETEFFLLAEALAEAEPAAAHDAGKGNGLIEGDLRGPLRDRVVAFGALVQANVNRVHRVHQRGGASHQQIRESRQRRPPVITAARFFSWKRLSKRSCSALNGLRVRCALRST